MGARVTVISSSDEKLARASELGSDIGVNYSEFPKWDEKVIEEVGREEIDLVIELGGATTLQRSLNCLKVGGRVSMIGVLSGNEVSMNISAVLAKWIAIQGITVSHREDFLKMNRFLESEGIRPIIDTVLPLGQVQMAYDELPRASHFGKLVLDHVTQ
jgi:NADPH:quinone reductase-like Zn-dependent oxidoreductase